MEVFVSLFSFNVESSVFYTSVFIAPEYLVLFTRNLIKVFQLM